MIHPTADVQSKNIGNETNISLCCPPYRRWWLCNSRVVFAKTSFYYANGGVA